MALVVKHIYTSAENRETEKQISKPGPFDVIVHLNSGDQFMACFYPVAPLLSPSATCKEIELDESKLYFWCKNMVLVADNEMDTVKRVVESMIEEGDFTLAFERV